MDLDEISRATGTILEEGSCHEPSSDLHSTSAIPSSPAAAISSSDAQRTRKLSTASVTSSLGSPPSVLRGVDRPNDSHLRSSRLMRTDLTNYSSSFEDAKTAVKPSASASALAIESPNSRRLTRTRRVHEGIRQMATMKAPDHVRDRDTTPR